MPTTTASSVLTGFPLVVLAEDDHSIRRVTGIALRRAGFEVIDACCCDEALMHLRASPAVQALVTDVVTPGRLDGYELARIVREEFPRLAVLIISAQKPSQEDAVLGVCHLAKPCDLTALGEIVRECIRVADLRLPG
jgi:DNA-binding NtrC family response regulator